MDVGAGRRSLRGGDIRFLAGAARPEQLPPRGAPEIAFAGRSNVGKSSLLNRFAGRRGLARVSKTPGRTQQINFFDVGGRLVLVDLPGYGFARAPRATQRQWQGLVERYLTSARPLRAVVVIVDVRRGVEADDAMLLDFLDAHGIPAILVATKVDKVPRAQRARQLAAIAAARPSLSPILFSAKTGEGVAELWKALKVCD